MCIAHTSPPEFVLRRLESQRGKAQFKRMFPKVLTTNFYKVFVIKSSLMRNWVSLLFLLFCVLNLDE